MDFCTCRVKFARTPALAAKGNSAFWGEDFVFE
jgi:hypothetical protein